MNEKHTTLWAQTDPSMVERPKHTTLLFGPVSAGAAMKERAGEIRRGRGNCYIRDISIYDPRDMEHAEKVEIWGPGGEEIEKAYGDYGARVERVGLDETGEAPSRAHQGEVRVQKIRGLGPDRYQVIHSLTGLPLNKVPLSKEEAEVMREDFERTGAVAEAQPEPPAPPSEPVPPPEPEPVPFVPAPKGRKEKEPDVPQLRKLIAGRGKFNIVREGEETPLNREPMDSKTSTQFMNDYLAYLAGDRQDPPEG